MTRAELLKRQGFRFLEDASCPNYTVEIYERPNDGQVEVLLEDHRATPIKRAVRRRRFVEAPFRCLAKAED